MSQTQLSNYGSLASLLVLILAYFDIYFTLDQMTFIVGVTCTTLFNAYNFYQRYQKGDLNLLGFRV